MQTPEEEESSRKSPGVEADDLNEAGLRRKVGRRSKVPGKTRDKQVLEGCTQDKQVLEEYKQNNGRRK